MLLFLAIGFVVGRVVVARNYFGSAPKIELQTPGTSELDERSAPLGSIHVPTPASRQADEKSGEEESREEPKPAGDESNRNASEAPKVGTSESPDQERPAERQAAEAHPEAKEPKAQEEPVAVGVYSIQVGVFSTEQGARQAMSDLTRAGYPARVSRDAHGGRDLFRVLTGRYRSEYAARKALEQLRSEGFEAFLNEQ